MDMTDVGLLLGYMYKIWAGTREEPTGRRRRHFSRCVVSDINHNNSIGHTVDADTAEASQKVNRAMIETYDKLEGMMRSVVCNGVFYTYFSLLLAERRRCPNPWIENVCRDKRTAREHGRKQDGDRVSSKRAAESIRTAPAEWRWKQQTNKNNNYDG